MCACVRACVRVCVCVFSFDCKWIFIVKVLTDFVERGWFQLVIFFLSETDLFVGFGSDICGKRCGNYARIRLNRPKETGADVSTAGIDSQRRVFGLNGGNRFSATGIRSQRRVFSLSDGHSISAAGIQSQRRVSILSDGYSVSAVGIRSQRLVSMTASGYGHVDSGSQGWTS